MPIWIEAGLWGLLAGGALVLGAVIALAVRVPQPVVAAVMAFGAGVLIATLAFDMMDEAEKTGGLGATVGGAIGGAVVYVAVNLVLARRGAAHRKRSGDQQPSEADQPGSGTAIAVGALLDGVPESVVLGLSLLAGGGVNTSVLAGIFISNLPEGLSSSAGMKRNGRSTRYVLAVWSGIAVASGVAGALGCLLLDGSGPQATAVITAVAAGAILAMVADTMIPEAFERAHLFTGIITTVGFLLAFLVDRA